MKTILLAMSAFLAGCASPQWEAVMRNRTAPGAYEAGACARYAENLGRRLPFPTVIVAWTATSAAPFPSTVRHAALAYEVDGESWFIDNVTCSPRWVGSVSDSLAARASQFCAPAAVRVSDVKIVARRADGSMR